jgi:hypothetical protein
MQQRDLNAVIDKDLAEALYPGNVRTWNLSRWVKNRRILQILLRSLLIHGVFQSTYVPAVGKSKKSALDHLRDLKKKEAAESDDTNLWQAPGIETAIMPFDASDGGTVEEMHRAQNVRVKHTIEWALMPYNAATGQGTAIPDLIVLSVLAALFEECLEDMVQISSLDWRYKQVVDEEELGPNGREYHVLMMATGAIILPLLVRVTHLLKLAGTHNHWLPFAKTRALNRTATNFLFTTITRLAGSVHLRMVARLRKPPYREFLDVDFVTDADLRARGAQHARSDLCVRGAMAKVFPVPDTDVGRADDAITKEAILREDRTHVVDVEWNHGVSKGYMEKGGYGPLRKFSKMAANFMLLMLNKWGWFGNLSKYIKLPMVLPTLRTLVFLICFSLLNSLLLNGAGHTHGRPNKTCTS